MAINVNKLRRLYTAIEKSLDTVLMAQAKDWLRFFTNEPWYDAAVKAYVEIAKEAGGILADHKQKVLAAIGQENLFIENVLPDVAAGTGEPVEATATASQVAVAGVVAGKTIAEAADGKAKRYKTWEYLDERYNKVVVPDVRDALVEMQQTFQTQLETFYQERIADTLMPDASKALFQNLGMTFNFNKYDEATRDYLRDKKIHWAKEVAEATEQEIKRELVGGYEKGLSSYEVTEKIKKSTGFSMARAEKIARTETIGACNYANYAAYQANDDVIGFRWRSANGKRTRATHRAANGQVRLKGIPFDVGGTKLMFPLDSSLGAPAKEIINCRCSIEPIFVGEESELEAAGVKDPQEKAANAAERNTGKKTEFDESADYAIDIKGYSKAALAGLSEASREVALLGSQDQTEHLRLIDLATGKTVFKDDKGSMMTVGGEDFWQVVKDNPDKGFAFIHNHVVDSSLSLADMETLLSNSNINVMIAVRNDGVKYVAQKKDGISRVKTRVENLYEDELKPLKEKLKDGTIYMSEFGSLKEKLLVDCLLRDYIIGGVEGCEKDGRK